VGLAGLLTATFAFFPAPVAASSAPGPAAPVPPASVFLYGPLENGGDGGPSALNAPVVGMAGTDHGYFLVAADGGVFTQGDAVFHGSLVGTPHQSVAGIAATPSLRGYWLAGRFGTVYPFGDAVSYGSEDATPLNAPIVGMAATPDGRGYWLAAADGGVFAFGDAPFYGSDGAMPLNAPVVGMAATPDGQGYWLVASDGGVFSFGDAVFHGSTGAVPLDTPVVGMAATSDGGGYWLAAGDGGVFAFGDAPFYGSATTPPPPHPIAAIATMGSSGAYLLATSATGPSPVPAEPQVNVCGTPQTQPASIILACADHNSRLVNLQWTSWSPTFARGTATYAYNLCVPDCAQGTFVSAPATVTLDERVSTSVGVEYSRVTWTYPGPGGLVNDREELLTDA
jgi:hypothetical protein